VSEPVPAEVQLLALSGILVVVQIVIAAQTANAQYGLRWAASPRDEVLPEPRPIVGRSRRALANLLETYPVFVAAVLAVAVTRRFDLWSFVGAHLYVWSRVVYLGLYLTGVPLVRSLVWNLALLGIVMILAQLL
jgi:uncharacterized MAPEG superfamily protein